MQPPRTGANVEHMDGQQDTGNQTEPGSPEAGGTGGVGGTRAGAENVEHVASDDVGSVETDDSLDAGNSGRERP